ncbi:MAG: murein L,D-transpeptidase, partial [Thermoanaerobaculia bacterium]
MNQPTTVTVARGSRDAAALRAAILLDRAHFSCGEIDAVYGQNVAGALAAFRTANRLPQSDSITPDVWQQLNEDTAPALVRYTITAEDAAGPFVAIPRLMMAKSKLAKMGYESLVEALGERFHASPQLLRKLNPGQPFTAGAPILVPNVRTSGPSEKSASVIVDGKKRTVTAYDATGKL